MRPHGEVSVHAQAGKPPPQRARGRPEVVGLGRETFVRGLAEPLAVPGASVVGDEHDFLQLVHPNQEVELRARGFEEGRVLRMPGHPGRATGDGPAIVARDLEMSVTELVESLTPAAIAAIQGQGPDPLRVPPLGRVVGGHRQVRAQRNGTRVDLETTVWP